MSPPQKKKKQSAPVKEDVVKEDMVRKQEEVTLEELKPPTDKIILEAEHDLAKRQMKQQECNAQYQRSHYSASTLSADVLRMETGLPTKEVFQIVVNYAARFRDSMLYYAGWKVESMLFEDQILIMLMKLRQNYTNLHLAQLYSCSVTTISNIVTTFVHVLHNILFKDVMTSIPTREKNKLCSPSSFRQCLAAAE